MIVNFTYLLCWLGIYKYKVVDITFGFGATGSTQKLKCKICGIEKVKKLGLWSEKIIVRAFT